MADISPNKIRSDHDHKRFRAALAPVDRAIWESEQKWGVGRLEGLVDPHILISWKKGWDEFRTALETGDPDLTESIGPKVIRALAFMDRHASANGHAPLAPDTWETPLGDDGTILVMVRSNAEQAAVIRAERHASAFSVHPGGGTRADTAPSAIDARLPADLMLTVRSQHEGRALEVWTIGELARLVLKHGSVARDGKKWQGEPTKSKVQHEEGATHDWVVSGYPMPGPLTGPTQTSSDQLRPTPTDTDNSRQLPTNTSKLDF